MKNLAPLVLLLAFLVGCSTTWEDTNGKLLVTTAQSVDSVMKGWATYVVILDPPESQQNRVKAAYQKYQTAFEASRKAYNVAATTKDQSVFERTSAALRASSKDLIALVQSFNPQIK